MVIHLTCFFEIMQSSSFSLVLVSRSSTFVHKPKISKARTFCLGGSSHNMFCPTQVFAQRNKPLHAWKGDWPMQPDFSFLPFIITVTLISISPVSSTFSWKSFSLLNQTCINRKSSTLSVMDLWTALIGRSKWKGLQRFLSLHPSHISWRSEDEEERSKIRGQICNDFCS